MRALLLGVALLAATPLAHADAPEIEIARGHSRRGAALYQQGKFAEAAAEFELARREMSIAELDYNLGRCYEGTGDIDAALDAYRRYLARPLTDESRAEVSERARLLEAASPRAHDRAERIRLHARMDRRWRVVYPVAVGVGALALAAGAASGALYARELRERDQLATPCPPSCAGDYDRLRTFDRATRAMFGLAISAAAIDVGLWSVALHARGRR